MKKILISILAVAAAAVSCTKFAEDAPIDFKDATAPEVKAVTLADDKIDVTVTAKEGTSFFSYIVAEGVASEINASTLLKGEYSSDAIEYGEEPVAEVLDYKNAQSVNITIDGLAANTPYTVYAVASNAQGVISEVAVATAVTTDGTDPIIVAAAAEETDEVLVFTISFNDVLKLGEGSVTADFLGFYAEPGTDGNLVAQKSVTIANDALAVSGKNFIVTIPAEEYIPGAIVALSYPEGIVTNALGAACAALNSSVSAEGKATGIATSYKAVTFPLSVYEDGKTPEDEELPIAFTDWETFRMDSYAQWDYTLADYGDEAAVTIAVADANGRTVTYSGKQFGITSDNSVAVLLDEDPGFGVTVSYTIAAGSILDIYGNSSEELVVEDRYLRSYGYTADDIIGVYTVTGLSPFVQGVEVSYPLEIKASDNEEYGNVMITNVLGFADGAKLYCEFNGDAGTLLIYEYDIFAGDQTNGLAIFFNQAGNKVCQCTPGNIQLPGNFIVAVVVGGSLTGYATDANGPVGVYGGVAVRQ